MAGPPATDGSVFMVGGGKRDPIVIMLKIRFTPEATYKLWHLWYEIFRQ